MGIFTKIKQGLSLLTFLTVFSLIVSGFDFTVEKSLTKETNLQLLAGLINKRQTEALAALQDRTEETKVLGETTEVKNSEQAACIRIEDTVSVVNFMDKAGLNPSYDSRERLAAQLGIKDYSGTAGQNLKLIEMLTPSIKCQE